MKPNNQLTPEQFDRLISNWNSTAARHRSGRETKCRETGSHYWVPTPYNQPEDFTIQEVCIFCIDYRCRPKPD